MERLDLLKVQEAQDAIIRLQSGVIDDLFLLLLQHVSAEELDGLPVIGKINEAARLRADMEGK